MEAYDIRVDDIMVWALDYADDDELEEAAKALYALYAERHPQRKKINKFKRGKK